jgi:hypothetical protein
VLAGLAPFSQTVGSLLRTNGQQARKKVWRIRFKAKMHSAKSKILQAFLLP